MLWNSLHWQTARALRPCLKPSFSTRLVPRPPGFRVPRTARFLSDTPPTIPSFREQVARTVVVESFSDHVKPSIRNQLIFFLGGSCVAFGYAAKETNIDTDYWSRKISKMSTIWSTRTPSSDEMRRTKTFELRAKLQGYVGTLKEATLGFPIALRNLIFITYVNIANPYLNTTEGRRLCWEIGLLNAFVWVMWQVPSLEGHMRRAFLHHPLSGLSYTLLTSVFSHKSFLHLAFNSIALASFGAAASNYLTREQYNSPSGLQESTSTWHFMAFFISAGLFSGLVSHVVSTRIIYPRLISQLSASGGATATTTAAVARAAGPKMDILPSLGASGAIYAAVTMTALAFPDAHVSPLLLPSVEIPAQWGVGALVLMDIIGVLRGWRRFDHYAHLGGAAFGAFYYVYGPAWWDYLRVCLSRPPETTS